MDSNTVQMGNSETTLSTVVNVLLTDKHRIRNVIS